MRYVFTGSLAFVFLFLFDVYTLNNHGTKKKIFGLLGVVLLIYSGIMVTATSERILFPFGVKVLAWVLFVVSSTLLIYSLFIELPFSKTYGKNKHSNMLVDTGTYALCRHPGVLWFGMMFFFFFFATGSLLLIPAGIIWTGLDVFHVYLQEKLFFPRMFPEYVSYIRTTPMLLPSIKSIQKCLATLL
jgi:protein-S-isoprenylcysteine O-methyltransferase Ste14